MIKQRSRINKSILKTTESRALTGDLSELENRLRTAFRQTADLKLEQIRIGPKDGLICYIYTMCDLNLLTERILKPVSAAAAHGDSEWLDTGWKAQAESLFAGSQHEWAATEQDVILKMLSGYTVITVAGETEAAAVFTQTSVHRQVMEPSTETVIKGPKDCFIEDITTNMTLLRRRIRNPALRFESYDIGTVTGTSIAVAYLDGIVNTGIVEEVRKRIRRIKTDAVYETTNIEEFIVDKTLTPFPLAYSTERPDSVASHVLSGKVAVLVDGSPFVLTVPAIFIDFQSSAEDYYQSFMMGSFLRLLRYGSFMLSFLLPAFYVSVITYHQELIPTPLLITIIAQREGIPFPAVVEAFIMEITFEILREAGVRMPRAVGGTISIVGGLVIGQAAVEAGIISNTMVIVVALTAIASFVAPIYNFSSASRLLRFGFVLLAGSFGLFGILLGMIVFVGHLCSLRSFGIPYLATIAPFATEEQKDVFIRMPFWRMKGRFKALKPELQGEQPLQHSPSPPPPKKDKEPEA